MQRRSPKPQRVKKAARVKAGNGVRTVSPPTVANRGPSSQTRAASLAMSARTRETKPAITVTSGVGTPFPRRQCAVHSAASVRRRRRSHSSAASGGGCQARRSSAKSTATDRGNRALVRDAHKSPTQVQTWCARGHVRNVCESVSNEGSPQVGWWQKRSPGAMAM